MLKCSVLTAHRSAPASSHARTAHKYLFSPLPSHSPRQSRPGMASPSSSPSRKALSKIACSRLQKELAEWQVNPPAGFKHRVTDDLQRCPSAIVALPIPSPQQAIPAVRGLLDSFLRGSVLGYRFLVRESRRLKSC
ncbi:putative ubiquitin-conjugating enzyme E2 18 [Zea mays]|uniref:Putative ubiquitin-conjugating enzyme E2 18 n=1 Tax=Zea mays TaxID=4577 RepID=A0A317Y832_MAIZE|nr:putative ubiquitin-conjugating enzyme E2 18 [Zea mays]